MLDWKWIKENKEATEEALQKRGMDSEILEELFSEDEKRRTVQREVDILRQKRNEISRLVASLKREGQNPQDALREGEKIAGKIKEEEEKLREIEEQWKEKLLFIPNIPHSTVPVGKDENDNQEVKRWGEPRDFSFTPRPHWEIGEGLDILDFERGAK
ncbi:MAG TPA: serine--tRNA ligase, partial [Candidatus Atribacteria bacterium]|nr:serine--tRNA ligase [Candidatus Atribacteria bacterium]